MVTNHTPNYGLPVTLPEDKVNWFDYNPAMTKIDETMKANETASKVAQETADSNTASIGNITQSLNNTIDRVTTQENAMTSLEQQVTLNTTHNNEQDTQLGLIKTQIEALEEEVGTGGTPTPGGESLTEKVEELQQNVSEISTNLATAQRDITNNADHIGNLNGLKTTEKSNLVNAVNEVFDKSQDVQMGNVNVNTMNNFANMALYQSTLIPQGINYDPLNPGDAIGEENLGRNGVQVKQWNTNVTFEPSEFGNSSAQKVVVFDFTPKAESANPPEDIQIILVECRNIRDPRSALNSGRTLYHNVQYTNNQITVTVTVTFPHFQIQGTVQGEAIPVQYTGTGNNLSLDLYVTMIYIPKTLLNNEMEAQILAAFKAEFINKQIFHN